MTSYFQDPILPKRFWVFADLKQKRPLLGGILTKPKMCSKQWVTFKEGLNQKMRTSCRGTKIFFGGKLVSEDYAPAVYGVNVAKLHEIS